MKLMSYQKEIDTVALLKKQMSSREVAEIVGLSQFSCQEEVGHKL
jgi:hypothetical protein